MKKLIVFLLLNSFNCFGQGEFKNWHFGQNNTIVFNPFPSLVSGSMINQTEGCATVSDEFGMLLFYTDGIRVWNRLNIQMANGFGLLGNSSSTQSSIIVKKPSSSSIYYVFTVDADIGVNGLRYSEVDMSLNTGLGDVTANKNVLLHTPSCEKITSVLHCNGEDVWVISHDWNSNTFRTWIVTSFGVSTTPVLSSVGYAPSTSIQQGYGYLKSNIYGNRLAAAYYGINNQAAGNRVEVYNFDNTSGIVSNAQLIGYFNGAYGVEWSKSGRYLYATANQGAIRQWDMCSSPITMYEQQMGAFGGSLQLANDGHIYISRGTNKFIGRIEFPEIFGAGCNINPSFLATTGQSRFGFPNFPPYLLRDTLTMFTYDEIDCGYYCFDVSEYFPNSCVWTNTYTYEWEFSDGTILSGTNVCRQYSSSMTETVVLRRTGVCTEDSISSNVLINSTDIISNITIN